MNLGRSFRVSEKVLLLLFLLSLPFIQPRVRGDGIGYYAYARSLLIDHNLCFDGDWKGPETGDVVVQGYENGRVIWSHYTKTGHRVNHFSIGPAMLWAPFLAATHIVVLGLDHLGWAIPPDGYSQPYLIAMGEATALYGFLGLWLSFQLARKYFEERWALLATVGIWFATSLPAYMYGDPSWPHAHSVFAGALFLWYWDRTRERRTPGQWVVFGLIAGLMLDVYYANFVFLLTPLMESFSEFRQARREAERRREATRRIVQCNLLFAVSAFIVFLPTLITRQIIFGNPFSMGLYTEWHWNWDRPALWSILFSPNRGLFVWTPIVIPAIVGLFILRRLAPKVGGIYLAIAAAYYVLIAMYPWWDGVSSFGNRYFITLTPIFIVGLSAAFAEFARLWGENRAAMRRILAVSSLLILWNLGLVFQWGARLLPANGPISWREVVYNQFRVVPGQLLHSLYDRIAGREKLEIARGG